MKIIYILIVLIMSISLCACGEAIDDGISESESYQESISEISGVVDEMILYGNHAKLKVRDSDGNLLTFIMNTSTHIYDDTYTNQEVHLSKGCHVKIEYLTKEHDYNEIKIQKITVTSYDGSFTV